MPRVSGQAPRRGNVPRGRGLLEHEAVRMRTTLDLAPLGLAVGHATDAAGATGITVIRGIDHPLRAGVAIFGRATGSRELHAASSEHLVDGRVDAIVLTGGSAYGLDAV